MIPTNIDNARKLDSEKSNNFREKAIEKEVSNVKIALQLL